MIIYKGFKYRLYPNNDQIQQLKQNAGNNRFVWNEFLAFTNAHKELFETYLYRYSLQDYLLYLKEEYPFLKLSYSQSLQYQALLLDKALKRAFDDNIKLSRNKIIALAMTETDEKKKGIKLVKAYNYGFPNYKKKSNYNDTMCYPQIFKVKENYINLPKLGDIKYKQHRNYEGKPKSITISQNGDCWYASICCELEIEDKQVKTDNIIGIDLGLKVFATLSDETVIDNPRIYHNSENKIKREQRKLSKRAKDSNRRKRQQLKVHKLHTKVKNKRKDFLHKLTHHMITKYDGFILEDLSSNNMMRNHKLAKNIQDVSWSEFAIILEYKSLWNFKYFEKIDRFAPSSQICHKCGNRQDMTLSERTYHCSECGNVVDRDLNASLNIKNFSNLTQSVKDTVGTTEIYGQGKTSLEVSLNCQKSPVLIAGSLL
jgi:putative transposase